MTNHEWLKSLNIEDYAVFEENRAGCPPTVCPYEIGDDEPDCPACWVRWLKEEHNE